MTNESIERLSRFKGHPVDYVFVAVFLREDISATASPQTLFIHGYVQNPHAKGTARQPQVTRLPSPATRPVSTPTPLRVSRANHPPQNHTERQRRRSKRAPTARRRQPTSSFATAWTPTSSARRALPPCTSLATTASRTASGSCWASRAPCAGPWC